MKQRKSKQVRLFSGMLIGIVMIAVLARIVYLNHCYPSPKVITYTDNDTIKLGNYEIKQTGWEWGDGSLDGYFQLLRDETDKSAQEHYIDIIQERITSLKDMLEELFMFTKLKNDSFKLELSNCCVSRLLKQTVFSYYEEWKKQGIEPLLDICEDTIFITANVQALRRVFQNVIKNALVHGQNSICIQMKQQDSCNCRTSDDERTSKNRIVHILVSNDVKNPDDIDVDKVFERFYKADEARSISSSGLGLSIAKELVERMGGSIEARLEGKRFVVEIQFECE